MGYTLYLPAPSPGRLPVDAPKRYGWGAPARSSSGRLGSGSRVLGPRPARAGCLVVPVFYFVSCLCLLSVAQPRGSGREPCPAPLRPEPRRPSGLCAAGFPTRAAHTPGAARDRDREDRLPGPGMCVRDPGLALTLGPAGSRDAP